MPFGALFVIIKIIMILVYLLKNFIVDVFLFFKHWYWDGFHFIYGKALGIIRNLEKSLAIRINLRFLFQPLYQEYNIYGYVLGFLFRLFRILFGGLGYLLIMIFFLIVYLIWAFFPIFVVYKTLNRQF